MKILVGIRRYSSLLGRNPEVRVSIMLNIEIFKNILLTIITSNHSGIIFAQYFCPTKTKKYGAKIQMYSSREKKSATKSTNTVNIFGKDHDKPAFFT